MGYRFLIRCVGGPLDMETRVCDTDKIAWPPKPEMKLHPYGVYRRRSVSTVHPKDGNEHFVPGAEYEWVPDAD